MNKRKQQSEERRLQILNCSLDMIISRGYEATKIRDIADKLQISTGLFFNYFESKEKVYEELVKIGMSGPQGIFQMNTDGSTPIEILKNIAEVILQSLKSYCMTAKMFILMLHTINSESAPESVKRIVGKFDAFTPIIPIIENGQKLGEIKAGNPTALAVAFWGAIQGIAEYRAIGPELPLPESDWIIDMLRA